MSPQKNWQAIAEGVDTPKELLIDGAWVLPVAGERMDVISPIDGHVIASVSLGAEEDVDRAVSSGRAAFEDGRWSRLAPSQRKVTLIRLSLIHI